MTNPTHGGRKPGLLALAAFVAIAIYPAFVLASCGSAFCTVNSNWTTESASVDAGSLLDLRYEFIDQDQPRAGREKIVVGQIRRHHNEVRTLNRNLLATYSRNFDASWGLSITAPILDREHAHIHNHHGAQLDERWDFTRLGDIRVVGRYQLPVIGDPRQPVSFGVNFGLKLPSGKFTVANGAGDVAERSLQPGSGTTDGIVGVYFHQQIPARASSWFVQAQYQQALNQRQEYKPGDRTTVDVGYRYGFNDKLGALIQLNLLWRGRDAGSNAEPADSGGRFAFASPGMSYAVSDRTQLYAFVQLPVFQRVNGVQLTSDRGFLIGLSSRF